MLRGWVDGHILWGLALLFYEYLKTLKQNFKGSVLGIRNVDIIICI